MEKEPQFIKEFSKEESSDDRQQTAKAIKSKRAEHFAEKSAKTEREIELQKTTSEREQALAERLQSMNNLENKIDELSTSGLRKILNYFQLRKLEADVVVGQKTYEELEKEQESETAEHQEISEKLESKEPSLELQEAKNMLGDFYKEQKGKWAKSEYTKEDIVKYFSEEHLASLSLEDYALLLKRFPKEMVAHVTRQGIRDHVGHMYHTAGEGAYSDNFMKMVKDGRLRSPLGVYLVEKEKEKAIAKFLNLGELKNKKEATEYLKNICGVKGADPESQTAHGDYSDSMAIHFATEGVADSYYGSEKGNEIFIAYPSAFIASQYYFTGQLNEADTGNHNDQWVWANEEKGMDLNAGLVFIPGEVRVDRKNGSRYELDENGSPIKNKEYQNTFKKFVDSPDFSDFAKRFMELTEKSYGKLDRTDPSPKVRELLERIEPFRKKLEKDFGITDERFQSVILNRSNLESIKYKVENRKKADGDERVLNNANLEIDDYIEDDLRREGILYLEAKNTVSSKEFWEDYFIKNPGKKPSKTIYYKESDPTAALLQWRQVQGIDKGAGAKDMGFPERHVNSWAPQAESGLDRFRTLAEKVIEDNFPKEESVAA
jgi:hypothetical protein